ncbi:hypothetical protein F4824DRAFT_467025 [Ustulina deusta]|nr:hypothetical protein F4824DRAFT_467025 [Ustulina deusta]
MKIDLEELLVAPSSLSSPAFQATPTMTPTRIRRGCWKKMRGTGGSYQGRRNLPEWTKWRPSQSNRPTYTDDGSDSEQDGYSGQPHGSRFEIAAPSPRRDDHDPVQGSPPPRSPPSTPQGPRPRPVPSATLSTRSAPARLEPSLTTDLTISAENINDAIIEVLRKPLSKSQLNSNKVGDIYLFEVTPAGDPDRTIMKIGHTVKTEQHRMKGIKRKCKPISIEREVDAQAVPILLYRKAEKLMHTHLDDRVYDFGCMCTKKHREYFDVDAATAQGVIRCWRAFCELDPYDASGELRPFWEHRLRQRKKLRHWGDRAAEGCSELESRRIRWEVFANPTPFEIFWFRATTAGSKAWPWRLHIIAVFEAIALDFLVSPPSYLSWMWFLILAICIFGE